MRNLMYDYIASATDMMNENNQDLEMPMMCGLQESDFKEDDLYDRCFESNKGVMVAKTDPSENFAKVLRQIETMELKVRASMELETVMPRGYVFAIHQIGSEYVTIGHGGRSHLHSTLRRLQISNPNKLEVIAVLQRYSFDDARAICDMIYSGMIMYCVNSRSWFTMENCKQKIINMFARIDVM